MNTLDQILGLRCYVPIPLKTLTDYWQKAGNGVVGHPLPWISPPVLNLHGIGARELRALFLVTNTNTAWELASYKEFYRIMIRDGWLKLVHPSGMEETILTAHGTAIPEATFLDHLGKVLPFRRKT